MMGQSNGGFSTWVIAQKTPDMFAGIIPSTGLFNINEVMNLSNMRVRFLTSDADPEHRHNTEGINQCPVMLNDFEMITYSIADLSSFLERNAKNYYFYIIRGAVNEIC